MKKLCLTLVLLLTLCLLGGCGGYVDKYAATSLIRSCFGREASMKFKTFQGTCNFKLKRDGVAENAVELKASLSEGEMNIYVGLDGERDLIYTVTGGDEYDQNIILDEKYESEKTIHVILETNGKCVDGEFSFQFND